MINYYKKSKKAFKEYIKQNPNCTKEEWDRYAQESCLFSAFTIEAHEITDNMLNTLRKKDENVFEFLKKKLCKKI